MPSSITARYLWLLLALISCATFSFAQTVTINEKPAQDKFDAKPEEKSPEPKQEAVAPEKESAEPEKSPEAKKESPKEGKEPEEKTPKSSKKEGAIPGFDTSWETRVDARTLTLTVPAPRGQITDRHGIPLAHTRVRYQAAINFLDLEKDDNQAIDAFANGVVSAVNSKLGQSWSLKAENAREHYKHRRWLPMVFSSLLTQEQHAKVLELGNLQKGITVQPIYIREYPKGESAGHIVGYVGKVRPQPFGEIVDGESLWPETEGRRGLEKSFDEDLVGKPGVINYLFGADGSKRVEETIQRPIPGKTIVTTLDAEWQALAERILAENTKRGALVVTDIETGEILVLASNPNFDPNEFVPAISRERFNQLNQDPNIPMYGRAYQGIYPPASTFKLIVALAGVDSGFLMKETFYPCPTALQIGDHLFHNWSKKDEGAMNVVTAIKRSCNTFFYRAGIDIGIQPISGMAQMLGFGQKTEIPLGGEGKGFYPTDEENIQKYGYRLSSGEIANTAIGQGRVEASPLQVAQAMAGIAKALHTATGVVPVKAQVVTEDENEPVIELNSSGGVVTTSQPVTFYAGARVYSDFPRMRIVKQIQDLDNRVVKTISKDSRTFEITPMALSLVANGMIDVVHAGNGTARRAQNGFVDVAAKTGTAQWGVINGEKRYAAWLSGFLPAYNPKYAFAALYEGEPGEYVTGGKKAAPIVGAFFKEVYEKMPKDQINGEIPAIVDFLKSGKAIAPPPPVAAQPVQQEEKKKRTWGGLFRLFRNKGKLPDERE